MESVTSIAPWSTNLLEHYSKGAFLGDGTYGVVHEGVDPATGEKVAIKRIRQDSFTNGVSPAALREVAVLQELCCTHHDNMVQLKDVFGYESNLYLVFEFCPFDLSQIILAKEVPLADSLVKSYTRSILEGVHFCHKRSILHRDLKPNNILVGTSGTLKLADFGLARSCVSPGRYSDNVVTRWYRAPELMFGCRRYGPSIDIWSVGCVLAEMILRAPMWEGNSDIHQLSLIFQVLGTPNEETWPGAKDLPLYIEFSNIPRKNLEDIFKGADALVLDLLRQLWHLDPEKRISAENALKHPYFRDCQSTTEGNAASVATMNAIKTKAESAKRAKESNLRSSLSSALTESTSLVLSQDNIRTNTLRRRMSPGSTSKKRLKL